MTGTPPDLRRAVFLDRDGTLNREVEGALADPDQLELLPGAAASVRRLAQAGYAVVVVTNQSAIGRGWMDPRDLLLVEKRLRGTLASEGAKLDLMLHCPHHPSEGIPPYRRPCECRKPGAGLLHRAARELALDLGRSWIVGDAERDLAAGQAVGARPILVATGKGRNQVEQARGSCPRLHFAENVAAATDHILATD